MDIEAVIIEVLVSLIILSISSSYINIFMAAVFHQNKLYFFIYFPIYISILLLLIISYFRAVFTSPGHALSTNNQVYSQQQILVFKQNAEKQKIRKQERKRTPNRRDLSQILQLKQTLFCEKCEAVKPPRTHHCKVCQKCITRMDHHCPWVGNCVGQENNKYFILFLMYATIGLTLTWATLCIDCFQNWVYVSTFRDQDIAINVMIVVIIASVLLSLSIGTLFVTQIIGVKENITTLQSFIPSIQDNSPFNNGSFEVNGKQIFGQSYWWIPVKPELNTLRY